MVFALVAVPHVVLIQNFIFLEFVEAIINGDHFIFILFFSGFLSLFDVYPLAFNLAG